MNRTLGLPAAVAALLLVTGCGGGSAASAEDFVTLAVAGGPNVDYEPMGPPEKALGEATLIVRGTLVDIFEGLEVEFPDEAMTDRYRGNFATYQVAVDDVLLGDNSLLVEGSIYVQVMKGPTTSVGELADANPRPSVVAILVDL